MGSGNWQVAKDHKAAFKDLIPAFGGLSAADRNLILTVFEGMIMMLKNLIINLKLYCK